ncbi:MAG: aminotransferase class [Bacteroidota bacterium]|nr:aminotransferase class [Bacteroidota bacterium]
MSEFGLIETIKVVNGRPVFKNLHVQRLCNSLKVIHINESEYKVEDRILRLLKYECIGKGLKNVRLRIEVQKNRMHDYMPDVDELKWNCLLKPLENSKFELNARGLKLTVLPKHKKQLDAFSNLKHTDRAIYDAAIEHAMTTRFDDAIVLNENNKVTDTSIYNIFMVKDGSVFTPPLEDGPVDGVLRKLLLTLLPQTKITERSITQEDLYTADEIFLTNAIRGIRWVNTIDDKHYTNSFTTNLFTEFSGVISEHFGEHLISDAVMK